MMTKRNVEAVYPLSPMQQGMLFHSIYDPDSRLYFEQMDCVLRGNLDVEAFCKAWQEVANRHPALRTVFAWKNIEKMLQVVQRQMDLPIDIQDWRELNREEQAKQLASYLANERKIGFDPAKGPLIRLALLRIDDNAYYFVESHHHALLDGWSLPLLLKEVLTLYEGYCAGDQIILDPVLPFKEYISWIAKQDNSAAETYWTEKLNGFTAPTPINFNRSTRISVDDEQIQQQETIGDLSIKLSKSTTDSLNELTRRYKVTINTLILAAWALLLGRYTNEEDVLFGATVSGRPAELIGVENMVGLFINTLPVRIQIHSGERVSEWIQSLQNQLIELRQYEYCSLIDIQEWSQIPRGKSLFESILIFENYPVDQSLRQQKGSLVIDEIHTREQTNYPLNLVSATGEQIPLRIVYDPLRFDDETIQYILGHLKTILEKIADNPNRPVSSIGLLSDSEMETILYEWNQTHTPFRDDLCVHELFELQVKKNPDAKAVTFDNQYLTYTQLDKRANQLAHYLSKLGVQEESLVGIYVERSIEMIVAILGVLKAGAAYIPLDPNYPIDRLGFMIRDSKINVLLTQEAIIDRLPYGEINENIAITRLDTDWENLVSKESEHKLEVNVTPENLAYVIYTSGSTGLPKGTMLRHLGVTNLATELKRVLEIDLGKNILQFSALSFDASVWETFMALANGGTLCLANQESLASATDLANIFIDQRITIVTLPPSMLRVLPDDSYPGLEKLVSAGEACTPDIVERWSPGRDFYNGYGPTETTVCASIYMSNEHEASSLPIGKPIANTKLYILDQFMNPVPVGIPGELYVSGVGVARGYLDRPEMTALKFVPDPFGNEPGQKLYKTGDLVRYFNDGNIEFLGRIDEQVKVRGYRIELGEIEAVLQNHPHIQQNAVVVWEDGLKNQYMVAYIEPVKDWAIDISQVRNFLGEKLPDYMIPQSFILLETLPLLPNGKVDRKSLQPPDSDRSRIDSPYVPPRTPVEIMLSEIWEQVLRINRVGINDNFFELGGHSLLATQAISRMRNVIQVDIPIRELFENPTISSLANIVEIALRRESGLDYPPIEKLPINEETGIPDGELKPSFSQQRLWFLDQLAPGNLFYNIPVAVKLKGILDYGALEYSINEIIRRHAALRTTFESIGGKPVQRIQPYQPMSIPVSDLTELSMEERDAEINQFVSQEAKHPFNLETGPLMRVRLLIIDHGDLEREPEHIIILVMHHIVSDGWSMGIFINEIGALYSARKARVVSPIPELQIQYYDFAAWQRNWLQGAVLETQLSYWSDQLANQPKMLNLPTDRPRPAVQTSRGDIAKFSLPQQLTQDIKALCRKENVTLFMVLIAAYQTLLSRYSGQDDISVGTAIAGRNLTDTENLIGFFVNTLVIRTDLSGDLTFRDLLKRVREIVLGAFAHQDLPFELLVEELQPERDLSHTPLFQVAFALQNAPTAERPSTMSDPTAHFIDVGEEGIGDQMLSVLEDLEMSQINVSSGTSKFDLTLSMAEGEDGLVGALEYNLDLFDPSTIQRMVEHYQVLLEGIVENPDLTIYRLPILGLTEKQRILEEWNNTDLPTPIDQCAHQRFEVHAQASPDSLALIFEDQILTYAELDRKANQLANYLIRKGVVIEDLIGISTYRSLEMVIGILGVLKAGCAYVPIDPMYPPDRIAFMMEDSQIKLLLTQADLVDQLPIDLLEMAPQIIRLDAEWESTIGKETAIKPEIPIISANLAYVIYTSGSTGLPKGTMLRHNGLCNLAEAQRQAFGIENSSRILQFSPLSFDASVWETFMALANGATLCLARQEVLASGIDMARYMDDKEVTNVTLPPSVLRVLSQDELPHLNTVIAAGEACTPELVERWAPGRDFFNAYGPTETTVCASMFLCDVVDNEAPPIGRPIANTKLYILDSDLQPVPIGVPGELHVSGISVARGYLRRPEMTAVKFVPDPFSKVLGSTLYRTGDLVRYRDDGNIEFLGRIDHQVKVRGFRIELGEIEAVLNDYMMVNEGVVVAREDIPGDPRLVAYIVPKTETNISQQESVDINDLKQFLRRKLPEYMVPTMYVVLDSLPISPSGKVDKKALPAPDLERPSLESAFVAPRNDVEEKLTQISGQLLGIEKVGVFDNFFELGGHSLLATQFISRVREEFGVELELRQLFETPTNAQIAEKIFELQSQKGDERDRVSELISRINELNDEEVIELLELKRKSKQIES